jgi:hypothetical protein
MHQLTTLAVTLLGVIAGWALAEWVISGRRQKPMDNQERDEHLTDTKNEAISLLHRVASTQWWYYYPDGSNGRRCVFCRGQNWDKDQGYVGNELMIKHRKGCVLLAMREFLNDVEGSEQ